ncbi:cytidine deaminase [Paraglaciecola sp. L3A3]|uniref:cytidine deaminase n=1 Tax=Paraglaciecola sp. L3A3 TaxID=2686358 RepID=UPI00131CDF31|nr:cytidine deaminase [Paraglaciecola sp. L3A3]
MFQSLPEVTTPLIEQALQAQKNAYAPYSKFHVGSAIIDEAGQIHSGCNVENAAYPLGQCAEAGAISAMVLSGNKLIKHIVIIGPTTDFCPPCGGCRQKIAEFADGQTQIHMVKKSGEIKTVAFKELLPFSFGFEKTDD